MSAKFELGTTVATPGALAAIREAGQSAIEFFQRHAACDWGDLDSHDLKENEIALQDGGRLMSSYKTRKDDAIWIITEADRSSTCLLLPSEY